MRILIVKTSALGDIVHAFPVLEWIKERFPEAEIDWVVERGGGATLLAAHPSISNLFTVDTQVWRRGLFRKATWKEIARLFSSLRAVEYDVLFDLQGNTKSSFFTAAVRARRKVGFGRASVSEWPNLLVTNWKRNHPPGVNVREEYLTLCRAFFSQNQERAKIPCVSTSLCLTEEEEKRRVPGRDGRTNVWMTTAGKNFWPSSLMHISRRFFSSIRVKRKKNVWRPLRRG
jgi:ADP-heptose:LPS heptosyltransferase